MHDVWDVIGLRGTGTDSYSVENLFIPEKFAALRDDTSAVQEKGPLYKLTTNAVFSMGFAATSLGVARATLDAAADLARTRDAPRNGEVSIFASAGELHRRWNFRGDEKHPRRTGARTARRASQRQRHSMEEHPAQRVRSIASDPES